MDDTGLETYEKVDMLEEAREHLQQAIELIKGVFPDDEYVKAYMIDHLRIQASSDHSFLSGDLNIDDLIERVRGDDD